MLDSSRTRPTRRSIIETTGPEIWRDTDGRITHFRLEHGHDRHHHGLLALLQGEERKIEIIGCQPQEGSQIPASQMARGYLPKIYDPKRVDRLEYVSQGEAEEMTRRLAREEGIFAGISSAARCHIALRVGAI